MEVLLQKAKNSRKMVILQFLCIACNLCFEAVVGAGIWVSAVPTTQAEVGLGFFVVSRVGLKPLIRCRCDRELFNMQSQPPDLPPLGVSDTHFHPPLILCMPRNPCLWWIESEKQISQLELHLHCNQKSLIFSHSSKRAWRKNQPLECLYLKFQPKIHGFLQCKSKFWYDAGFSSHESSCFRAIACRVATSHARALITIKLVWANTNVFLWVFPVV